MTRLTVVQYAGHDSGIPIPGWPTHDLAGIMDALQRWTLDPSGEMADSMPVIPLAYGEPFKCKAWCGCRQLRRYYDNGDIAVDYIATEPIYPEAPDAIAYSGNFLAYSFAFHVDTNDQELIETLDALIAANMASPEYQSAKNAKSIWGKK